jgi:hypothetical protein
MEAIQVRCSLDSRMKTNKEQGEMDLNFLLLLQHVVR